MDRQPLQSSILIACRIVSTGRNSTLPAAFAAGLRVRLDALPLGCVNTSSYRLEGVQLCQGEDSYWVIKVSGLKRVL